MTSTKHIVIAAVLLAATSSAAYALDAKEQIPPADWKARAEQAYRKSFPDWKTKEAQLAKILEQAAKENAEKIEQETRRAELQAQAAKQKETQRAELEARLKIQARPMGRICTTADPYCGMSFEEVERHNQKTVQQQQEAIAAEERQKREYQAQQAEKAKADADQRAKAQAEYDALPPEEKARREATLKTQAQQLKLFEAYAEFAFIKWCHDVREGYVYGAINDSELERAQTVVRSVVAQSTKLDATIDTDKLWKMGLDLVKPRMDPRKVEQPGFSFVCHDALRQLYELSPVPVYSIAKP
jgi:hypothetical protein